jgi:hypothetical protein
MSFWLHHRGRKSSRKGKRGVDLISDALPFGWLCYGDPNAIGNAISYATFYSQGVCSSSMVWNFAVPSFAGLVFQRGEAEIELERQRPMKAMVPDRFGCLFI